MSTYVIGDVQGCYDELMQLLDKIKFDEANDELWFVGDLVNRGPKSLDVLRFIKKLKNKKVVLGNHDLHLLAIANGAKESRDSKTLDAILTATDCDELLDWLRKQPLLHYDEKFNIVMVHAGLSPQWSLAKAKQCASEVETSLQSENYKALLLAIYGNEPDYWHDDLTSWDRYRYIINAFTRMRFCDEKDHLDFFEIGPVGSQKNNLIPWFDMPARQQDDFKIVFGHWASLKGKTNKENTIGLDTGCVWGGELTALRLEDNKKFSINQEGKTNYARK